MSTWCLNGLVTHQCSNAVELLYRSKPEDYWDYIHEVFDTDHWQISIRLAITNGICHTMLLISRQTILKVDILTLH